MKKAFAYFRVTTLVLGLAVAVAPVLTPTPAGAQDDDYGGSFNVRQHGYEHGYRDGFEYGRDARGRNVALDYRTDAYRDADHGYRPYFGSIAEYREGYRQGYGNGAEDGYNGSRARLGEVFSRRDQTFDPDRNRDDHSRAYSDRHWDYQDVASDVGYRDGVNAGLKDFREHHSFRPEEHDAWKDADHGYNNAFGSKADYKRAYRAAYEAGYRDGFGVR